MVIPLSKFNQAVGTRLVLQTDPQSHAINVVAGALEGRDAHFNPETAYIENVEIRRALRHSMRAAYGESVTRALIKDAKRTNSWDRSRPLSDMEISTVTGDAKRHGGAILQQIGRTQDDIFNFAFNRHDWPDGRFTYSRDLENISPQNTTLDVVFARARQRNQWDHLGDHGVYSHDLAELFRLEVESDPNFGWMTITPEELVEHAENAMIKFSAQTHRQLVADDVDHFMTPHNWGHRPFLSEDDWSQLPDQSIGFDTVFVYLRSRDIYHQLAGIKDSDINNPGLRTLFMYEVRNDPRFGRERIYTDDYVQFAQEAIIKLAQFRQKAIKEQTLEEAIDFFSCRQQWEGTPYIDDETLANLPDENTTFDIIFIHGRSQNQAWPELSDADIDNPLLVRLFFDEVRNAPGYGKIPMTTENYVNHAKAALGRLNAILKVERRSGAAPGA